MRRYLDCGTVLCAFFAPVVIAGLLAGCADQPTKPELRLGKTGYERGPGYGLHGIDRRGLGAPGSVEQFQSLGMDTVYFASDSSDLSPEAQSTLTQQAHWLQRYASHTITIEGHADERGTREYNIALGARRATSVRNFLVGNGVAVARIRTISYGKERPVAGCDDISCWSRNRRAQTVLAAAVASMR